MTNARCTHCGAIILENETACDICGAPRQQPAESPDNAAEMRSQVNLTYTAEVLVPPGPAQSGYAYTAMPPGRVPQLPLTPPAMLPQAAQRGSDSRSIIGYAIAGVGSLVAIAAMVFLPYISFLFPASGVLHQPVNVQITLLQTAPYLWFPAFPLFIFILPLFILPLTIALNAARCVIRHQIIGGTSARNREIATPILCIVFSTQSLLMQWEIQPFIFLFATFGAFGSLTYAASAHGNVPPAISFGTGVTLSFIGLFLALVGSIVQLVLVLVRRTR